MDLPTDRRGRTIEKLLIEEQLVYLNNGSKSHYHIQNKLESAIDLSIITLDLEPELEWEVSDHLRFSDHYPIFISSKKIPYQKRTPQMKSKGSWLEKVNSQKVFEIEEKSQGRVFNDGGDGGSSHMRKNPKYPWKAILYPPSPHLWSSDRVWTKNKK